MKKSLFKVLVLFTFILLVTTACSSSKKDNGMTENKTDSEVSYSTSKSNDGMSYDMSMEDNSDVEKAKVEGTGTEETSQSVSTTRKLIKRVYLNLQTLDFTSSLEFILDEVKKEGGYIENSDIQGDEIYGRSNKYASLVIRIPSEKVDNFVNLIGDNITVTNKSEETEDVTRDYVDTESRIKMLKIEEERLLSYMEKAESLKDIITLEERLSEVRYELERYSATLKNYDDLVAYSTVTINLYEVEKIDEKVNKEEISAFSRMATGLKESIVDIKDGFVNFFVWFVIKLPYLIIWGIIITVFVILALKVDKKIRGKVSTTQDLASTTQDLANNSKEKNDTQNKE